MNTTESGATIGQQQAAMGAHAFEHPKPSEPPASSEQHPAPAAPATNAEASIRAEVGQLS